MLIAVLTTLAACGLGFVAYTRIFPRAASANRECGCAEADGGEARAATRRTQNEYASQALAAWAAAKAVGPAPPAPSGTPPPPAAEPPADDVEPPTPPTKEEIVARQKADALTLDNQLDGEEVDGPWATRIERETTEVMSRMSNKFRLEGVTCRETICRARVTHLDPHAREQDVDQLMSLPVVTAQAFAFAPPGDDRTTVLYFSRKGTTLSSLQPSLDLTTIPAHILDSLPPAEP